MKDGNLYVYRTQICKSFHLRRGRKKSKQNESVKAIYGEALWVRVRVRERGGIFPSSLHSRGFSKFPEPFSLAKIFPSLKDLYCMTELAIFLRFGRGPPSVFIGAHLSKNVC